MDYIYIVTAVQVVIGSKQVGIINRARIRESVPSWLKSTESKKHQGLFQLLHSCQVSRNGRDSPRTLAHVPDDSTNVPEFSHKP